METTTTTTVPKDWTIRRFQLNDASPELLANALVRDGGCIVRGLVTQETIDQIERDVRPHFQQEQSPLDEDGFPARSSRVQGIVSRSRTWTNSLIGNKLFQDTANVILSSSITYWYGDERICQTNSPKLCSALGFSVLPGAEAQGLHRDCVMHHNTLSEITWEQYQAGRDTQLGMFVAAKKGTRENGVTRFVPRSHLWGMETKPREELAVYVEMEKGDAFFMLGSCYHGASANNTQDEERLIFATFMTKGHLRSHENQFLAHSREIVASYDDRIQGIVGYNLSTPLLGWVDWREPKALLGSEDNQYHKNSEA